jgi:Virulence activator alpha C-term
LILERREWAEAKVQRYERLRNRILDGLSEEEFLATAPRVGPYLTLIRGISFEEENLRWARRALVIVDQRQGAGSVR